MSEAKSDVRELSPAKSAAELARLHSEWRLCAERAEVASQVRSRITHASDHLDAMREARELHEALQAASTQAYEAYVAAMRGGL